MKLESSLGMPINKSDLIKPSKISFTMLKKARKTEQEKLQATQNA
jgi:hypothetical protein